MPLHCLNFDKVGFEYQSSTEPLLKNLSIQFTPGWCGIIWPNGSGETTVLRLACGEIAPTTRADESSGLAVDRMYGTGIVASAMCARPCEPRSAVSEKSDEKYLAAHCFRKSHDS